MHVYHDKKQVGHGGIFPEMALLDLACLPVRPCSTPVGADRMELVLSPAC